MAAPMILLPHSSQFTNDCIKLGHTLCHRHIENYHYSDFKACHCLGEEIHRERGRGNEDLQSRFRERQESVQVVSIDGRSVHGWDGDRAAVFLRGRSGSSVSIRLARRTQQVPGQAAKPDLPLRTEYKKAWPHLFQLE